MIKLDIYVCVSWLFAILYGENKNIVTYAKMLSAKFVCLFRPVSYVFTEET
jgi:hypothetical protein